jgi:hypothetical protein
VAARNKKYIEIKFGKVKAWVKADQQAWEFVAEGVGATSTGSKNDTEVG